MVTYGTKTSNICLMLAGVETYQTCAEFGDVTIVHTQTKCQTHVQLQLTIRIGS